MPRYFFHMRGVDGESSRDSEGQELPDLEAAKDEAVNALREMASELLLHGGAKGQREIEIAGDDGKVLAVVTARDVLLNRGELRDFPDDAAKSSHTAPSLEAERKFGEEQQRQARETAKSPKSAGRKLAQEPE